MTDRADLKAKLAGLSPERRALLLKKAQERKGASVPLTRRPAGSDAPLSFSQSRLWLIDTIEGSAAGYVIPMALRLVGDLDVAALVAGVNAVVARHEALRTTFDDASGEPRQIVADRLVVDAPTIDLRSIPADEREAELARLLDGEQRRPFNLRTGPLIRTTLYRLGDDERVFMIAVHHIVFDGWSVGRLVDELIRLYAEKCGGAPADLPALPIQYADYAIWERTVLAGERLERLIDGWKTILDGAPPTLDPPTDKPRPATFAHEGAFVSVPDGGGLKKNIDLLARRENASPFMVAMAAFVATLGRYAGEEDIVVGFPIAHRTRPEVEPLIGFFANTLMIRGDLSGDPDFSELTGRIRKSALAAYDLQELPFEKLVEEMKVERSLSHAPIFQAMLAWDTVETGGAAPGGLTVSRVDLPAVTSHYDLTLAMNESRDTIDALIEYNTALFTAATMERLARSYAALLRAAVAHPNTPVAALPILDADEERLVTDRWPTGTAAPLPGEGLATIVAAQAAAAPTATALSYAGATMTYAALERRSNRMAAYLVGRGVRPGDVVGLMLPRGFDFVVTMVAALKAGAAYMPLDPDYPDDRITRMLLASGAAHLVTDSDLIAERPFLPLVNGGHRTAPTVATPPRAMITDLDALPFVDRRLVDYADYHRHIGIAPFKHTASMQGTRGCPYKCVYCHDIWPKKLIKRSAGNVFAEISRLVDVGVRRFVFVDDIFNLDRKNSGALLEMIVKADLDVQLFFPNGLRGDVLTRAYIDLMVEAGTVNIDLALETASPRMQAAIAKRLNIERFMENVIYIAETYPGILLEMEMMFGFPTETKEEALMTIDALNRIKWIHFPNLNIVKIFPNSPLHAYAKELGIDEGAILRSSGLSYHEPPETLSYEADFIRELQATFFAEYFSDKERLHALLPHQAALMSADEFVRKYDSYLPIPIGSPADVYRFFDLDPAVTDALVFADDTAYAAPDATEKLRAAGPRATAPDAMRLLLLDVTLLYSSDARGALYDMVQEPLGLMALMSYLQEAFGEKIDGRIAKARIDFDSHDALARLIADFKPDVIGVRAMSTAKDFFHRVAAVIGHAAPGVPLVVGGPYASSEYETILADPHVDIVVKGEGEATFAELLGLIREYGGKLPPEARLRDVAGVVFADSAGGRRGGVDVILLDRAAAELALLPDTPVDVAVGADDPAYVLFTSGSTGEPKGVTMPHGPLANLVAWQKRQAGFTGPAAVAGFAAVTFDVHAQEYWSTFATGGRVVIVPEEIRRDMSALLTFIDDERIERLFLPYVALNQLAETAVREGRYPTAVGEVVTAGERLVVTPAIRAFFSRLPGARLHNQYGPTESHVVTSLTLDGDPNRWPATPSIGRPIDNAVTRIADPRGRPVPPGAVGEIFIGGPVLAAGYVNDPQRTAERFVVVDGARYYRTGDRARFLPDGALDYRGRGDHQVKIRGYRIEPGEIEAVIAGHPAVGDVAVAVRTSPEGILSLAAYATSTGAGIDADRLRDHLRRHLPEYMIPARIEMVDAFPLTPSGKVDRLALARRAAAETPVGEEVYRPVVDLLREIWRQILDAPDVGLDDNFFDKGGHSLLATRMVVRINELFGARLTVREVFERQTVRAMAARLEEESRLGGEPLPPLLPSTDGGPIPLSYAQERLWIDSRMEGPSPKYNMAAALLLDGPFDRSAMEEAITLLTARHETLRSRFVDTGDGPHTVIDDPAPCDLTPLALDDRPAEAREEAMRRFMADESSAPFDLAAGPPFRARLVRLEEGKHLLTLTMSHIVSDGWSLGVMANELSSLYNRRVAGGGETPAPLPIQYGDYARWQRKLLSGERLDRIVGYWTDRLRGAPAILNLSTAKADEATAAAGGVTFAAYDADFVRRIGELGRKGGATLYMTLFAAYAALLARLSGQEDIVIGAPMANRTVREVEPLIGFFVNVLPVRIDLSGDPPFADVVARAREGLLAAYAHQEAPLDLIVKAVNPPRAAGRHPLFQAAFILQNHQEVSLDLSGLDISLIGQEKVTPKYDLLMAFSPDPNGLTGLIEYKTGMFTETAMEATLARHRAVLEQACDDPSIRLLDLALGERLPAPAAETTADVGDFDF